jgi:Tfp pilus assembly protein PilN
VIVRINLLPHRELKRQRQKQAFFLMSGLSVVAGAALVLLVWSVLEGISTPSKAATS